MFKCLYLVFFFFVKAKVEYIEDLADALKYGELMTKYNKIQKEIINVKLNNEKIKSDLNEKYEMKNKLIQTIELKQGKMYLAKQKIETHNKHIEVLKEMSDISNAFSIEANENLTATDYEVILFYAFKICSFII